MQWKRNGPGCAGEADDAVAGLEPGDRWSAAPRARVLRLLPHLMDLYNPDRVALLSDEASAVATSAAERWLELLPHGGIVHLTPGGQACALLGGRFTYLGALDE